MHYFEKFLVQELKNNDKQDQNNNNIDDKKGKQPIFVNNTYIDLSPYIIAQKIKSYDPSKRN